MHIATSLLTVMARPSCTTVRLFGASQMCVYGGGAVLQGGVGDRHLATVPQGVVGDRLPWGGERQGGGGGTSWTPMGSRQNAYVPRRLPPSSNTITQQQTVTNHQGYEDPCDACINAGWPLPFLPG